MTTAPVAATASRTRTRRGPGFLGRLPIHLVIVFLMLIWLIPTIGLLVNSLRPPDEVTKSGWWTVLFNPSQLTLDNYKFVLAQDSITSGFINSLFISIPATIIPIMVAAFAAYAFAWMSFPGRDVLFILVVGLLVVPLQSTFIPILQLYGPKGFNIAGSFLAVWLAHTGYGLPFAIYLLRNYFGSLPREVFESAAIDGASPSRTRDASSRVSVAITRARVLSSWSLSAASARPGLSSSVVRMAADAGSAFTPSNGQ